MIWEPGFKLYQLPRNLAPLIHGGGSPLSRYCKSGATQSSSKLITVEHAIFNTKNHQGLSF